MANRYCEVLGINVPSLAQVRDHREAITYSLLIVALLERGDAMTLREVAERFEAAGVAPVERALASLKRCQPARAPLYRDGDHYALDPHDHEADLWAFRLGLRPPRVSAPPAVRPGPVPLPGLDEPLTVAELDEAFTEANLYALSVQRLALAVLDALGEPKKPEDLVAFVGARTQWHLLTPASAKFKRPGSAVIVRPDGRWEIGTDQEKLISARKAVRDRIAMVRRWASMRTDPAQVKANLKAADERRTAHADQLASLSRVLVHAFPAKEPGAVTLVDVSRREIETFPREAYDAARARIDSYDVIAAVNVRSLLRALAIDPGEQRLAELGPPQKSKKIGEHGRTLKITTAMLIQGSCGIAQPFGDEKRMLAYLSEGRTAQFRRRLEADAWSLFALYEYGRLHGAVRLRWRNLDEMIAAPWVHHDEKGLYDLMRQAQERSLVLEVVCGRAPGWTEPRTRTILCRVVRDPDGYDMFLVDKGGFVVDERDVQLARLAETSS